MNRFGNYPTPTASSSQAAYPNLMMHANPMIYRGMHPGMLVWNNWLMVIPLAISLVILVDLILVGVWLWKQIKKK